VRPLSRELLRLNQSGLAYREYWRVRVGENAEQWNWRAWKVQMIFPPFQLAFIGLAAAGSLAHLPALIVVGAICEVVAIIAILMRIIYRHRFYVEASRTLGVRICWYRSIPLNEAKYIRWCAQRGISPFRAAVDQRHNSYDRKLNMRSSEPGGADSSQMRNSGRNGDNNS